MAGHAMTKAWYERNRASVIARTNAWRDAHPDEVREITARYRQSDKYRATYRAWRERNRVRLAWREATRNYGQEVDFATFAAVWAGTCFDCGQTPAMGVDHVIGQTRGGLNVASNLQPACTPCNKRKGAKEKGEA